VRTDKKSSPKADKKPSVGRHGQSVVGYSKKSALLEEAITLMNAGKYGRSSSALKELLGLDPQNTEARRLFATLHLRLGSLVTAREAFESLANEAIGRQDYWLAESLLREYLAAGPRCIPFLELLAHVYQEKGDTMAAVAELGKAIEILLEDPDPDNPKKPAHLYMKVRELAPISPVAFQFATSFDIQTGEFRLPQRNVSDRQPSTDIREAHPIATSVSAIEPPAPTEITPGDQLDESLHIAPTSSHPDNSTETIGVWTTSGSSDPGLVSTKNQSGEPEPPVDFLPETRPTIEAPLFERRKSTASIDQPIDEPAVPPTISDEPLVESAPDISVEPMVPVTPASLPSGIPWEHVPDQVLQVIESEPSSVTLSSPDGISLSDSAPALSLTPLVETIPEPSTQNPTDKTVHQSEAHTVDQSSPIPDPILESPSPAPSSPPSFTWKEIFDSAWKVTVSATAAGSPVKVKEPAGTPQPDEEKPVGTVIDTAKSAHVAEQAVPLSTAFSPSNTTVEMIPQTPAAPSAMSPADGSMEEQPSLVAPLQPKEAPSTGPLELPPNVSSLTFTAHESVPHVEQPVEVVEPPSIDEPSPISSASVMDTRPVTETSIPSPSWNSADDAVQLMTSSPAYEPLSESVSDLSKGRESTIEESAPVAVPEEIQPSSIDTRPEWAIASDSVVLDQLSSPSPSWQESARDSIYTIDEPPPSPVASTVDVRSGSSETREAGRTSGCVAAPNPRPMFAARLARLRIGIASLILSCFSTTRAFVLMCVSVTILCVVAAAVGVGVIALAWIVMEEAPTSHYQSLTATEPQRVVSELKKNGFLLLMGLDAPAGSDPIQTGYERKMSGHDLSAAHVCMAGHDAKGASRTGASSNVIDRWFERVDPLTALKGQPETVKSVLAQESTLLARYQQWLTMPFDDWGFGQILSPNCPRILLAHRLYLLGGFNQDTATGVSRLEKDMESWRGAMGQAKTLMVKMLAATAVQDDVVLASDLLTRPDTDATTVSRLAKVVRPLDQLELSVRWPMQSHFVWATRNVTAELKKDGTGERSFYASVAAAMPLPLQRRANSYAEYYESANRAVAEGRYVNLPKPSQFIRSSPSNILDYLANPIEHIVGIEPLPSWDPYVSRMIETDAQLRLASLQAWVRRGPQDGDVLARLAKAGQAYYDPFTGLPMLVNQSKRMLYSIGKDGKDQEGDRRLDVVVAIPSQASSEPKRSSK